MGNTFKDGKLDFFPHDTNFSINYKVKLIRSEFGHDGTSIFWALLEQIYGDEGYYMDWNEDKAFLMAGDFGFKKEYVEQIVNRLVSRSLFNDKLFYSVRALTSKRIQNTYIKACSERTEIRIRKDLNLLNDEDLKKLPDKAFKKLVFIEINHEEKAINSGFNRINPWVNKQSRVKHSKIKKSKLNESIVKVYAPFKTPEPVETVDKSNKYIAMLTVRFDKIMLFRETDIMMYSKKYPNVNIVYEIHGMQVWIDNEIENGGNFKNLDVYKFIDDWFVRTQKSGGSKKVSESEMNEIIKRYEILLRRENAEEGEKN